jgi:hypothetical protein
MPDQPVSPPGQNRYCDDQEQNDYQDKRANPSATFCKSIRWAGRKVTANISHRHIVACLPLAQAARYQVEVRL